MPPTPVYAFEVSVQGTDPRWASIVNAPSAGRAKAEYYRSVTESWPDIPYTAIKARKLGAPHTSEGFRRTAAYRGMPNLKCGQRVKVGNATGTIVSNNDSANFGVLFDDDSPQYQGLTLNCHPDSLTLI